jgi:hypothetical protein
MEHSAVFLFDLLMPITMQNLSLLPVPLVHPKSTDVGHSKSHFWYGYSLKGRPITLLNLELPMQFNYSFYHDFFINKKGLEQELESFLPDLWRKNYHFRFRVYGTSFFLTLQNAKDALTATDQNLLIASEKSHYIRILTGCNLVLCGFKKKVIVFYHSSLRALIDVVSNLQKHWSISVYRRKGISFWRSRFRFRRGKKKFQ